MWDIGLNISNRKKLRVQKLAYRIYTQLIFCKDVKKIQWDEIMAFQQLMLTQVDNHVDKNQQHKN